eukprot:scaffold195334_cov31-Attheya_sp.AAC.2
MRNTEERTRDLDPLLAHNTTQLQVHHRQGYCDEDQGDFLLQRENLSCHHTGTCTGTDGGSSLSVSSPPAGRGVLLLDHGDDDVNHNITTTPPLSKRVNSMLGMAYAAAVTESPVEHTSEQSHDSEQIIIDASSRKRQRRSTRSSHA